MNSKFLPLIITISCMLFIFLLILMIFFILLKIDQINFKYIIPEFKRSSVCIPKIIYKTGPIKSNELPKDLVKIFNDTIELNPDYKIKYFDDNMARIFIKDNFSKDILDAYDCLIPGAYKADLFRYCILYKNGGVYSDLTQQFYLPFSRIINNCYDRLVLVKDIEKINYNFKIAIQINFIATIPKQKIFKLAIDKIVFNVKNKYYGLNSLEPTGPSLFRKCFDQIKPKYRMEIVFRKISNKINGTGGYIFNTNELVYTNKALIHEKYIKSKVHYGKLWKSRKIYK